MRKNSFHQITAAVLGVGVAGFNSSAQEPASLYADLDKDGKNEVIKFEKFADNEELGAFYQIVIVDDDGMSPIWNGPRTIDLENPLVFGAWHHGISFPEIAMDIDSDGHIEVVAPMPASDIAPAEFQVYRWKAGRLLLSKRGILLETPPGSGEFPWSNSDEWQGTWISGFAGEAEDGSIAVNVMAFDGGTSIKTGLARVSSTPVGFQLEEWIEPLSGTEEEAAIESENTVYYARLSRGDHFNSSGNPLSEVIQVLRQDRANFHKGEKDMEDTPDYIFTNAASREQMEQLPAIPVNESRASWEKEIMLGQPYVEVTIGADALYVEILEP